MYRTVWTILFAWMVFTSAGAAIVYADSADDVRAAFAALDKDDWATAERFCSAAIKAGDLRGEPLAAAHFACGIARWGQGRRDEALRDFTEAVNHTERGTERWAIIMRTRLSLYLAMERWKDAATDFLTLAQARPEGARLVDYDHVSRIVWRLIDTDEGTTFDVLKAMRDIGYVADSPGENLDYTSLVYVRLLAQRGDHAAAIGELAKMVTADVLLEARIDRRYDALWNRPGFDSATDPKEIASREVVHTTQLLQRFPDVASVVTRHVSALRTVGEGAKAVDVARAALANPSLKTDEYDEDQAGKLWLRNELVYALRDLGRLDEMFAEMEPILKLDETKNGSMVSQLINFGAIMVELDRGADGVKTARRAWNTASTFGKMFIHMAEVCANATSDKPVAESALQLLRQGQAENYPAMTQALLCMDRIDEAAALVKTRLSLPGARADVLKAVQTYKFPPFVTPLRKKLMERYAAILARPDIQTEIKKHGRVESFPFISGYWGNL